MVPKSDHLANPRFDKKPSAQVRRHGGQVPALQHEQGQLLQVRLHLQVQAPRIIDWADPEGEEHT